MSLTTRLTSIMHRVRGDVGSELAALAHPSAFSWRVAVPFASISGLAQMVYDAEHSDHSIIDWVMPTVASVSVYFAVFAALGRFSRRHSLKPAQVMLCFIVAGSARTMGVGAAAMVLDVAASMDWGFRVSAGILLSPALLVLLAIGVVRHDMHLDVVTELQTERDHLLDIGESMETALARTEDEITVAVRAAIAPALGALDAALDRVIADESSLSVVNTLSSLIDDEVRPLSHRLATQDRYVPVFSDRAREPRRVRVPLPSRVAMSDGIRPVFVALVFFCVAAPTVVRHSAFDIALVRLSWGALVSLIVLSVLKMIVSPIHTSAIAAVVLVAGVHALAEIFFVPILQGSWLPLSQGERLVGVQVAMVVGAMTTIAVVVDARRLATQRELVRVVAELNNAVEMMRRRARLANTRLAHVLHGSLQGALHAAAIRLTETKHPDSVLVETIRHDIAIALERIDDRAWGGANLQRTLDEIVAVWSGHRSVVAEVTPAAVAALASDTDADAATAEVVREAVNNAVRHGRARSVSIEVDMFDECENLASSRHCVQLTVTDDGSGWLSDAPRGLGTLLFDELCLTWRHIDTGGGTQFVATVGVHALLSDTRVN